MELIFYALLTFIATLVGTMTGFGVSTIMVPILSFIFPLSQTLLFVGIINWFGDVWKMIFFKKGFHGKLILLFGVPGIILSFFAARLPITLPKELLGRSLGLFLIIYVSFSFFKPGWEIKPSNISAILGGSLSGFFSGILGVGGAIRITFLTAFNLEKSVFIFTSGAIAFLIDSSRITQYWLSGIRLNNNLITTLAVCVPTSLIGAYIAKKFVIKISQKYFRLIVAIALFVIGARYLFIPAL